MKKSNEPISCQKYLLLLLLLCQTYAKSSGSSGGRSSGGSYSSSGRSYYSSSSGGSGSWWISLIVIGVFVIVVIVIFKIVASKLGVGCCALFQYTLCCQTGELNKMRESYIQRKATLGASRSDIYDINASREIQQQPDDSSRSSIGPDQTRREESVIVAGYPLNNLQQQSLPQIQKPGLQDQNQFQFQPPPLPVGYSNQQRLNQVPTESEESENSSDQSSEIEIETNQRSNQGKDNKQIKSQSKDLHHGKYQKEKEKQQTPVNGGWSNQSQVQQSGKKQKLYPLPDQMDPIQNNFINQNANIPHAYR